VRDFLCYNDLQKGNQTMPMTMEEYEEVIKRKRHPVVYCQVGAHPIYGNHISSGDAYYKMLNGRPTCFEHFKELSSRIDNAGRDPSY